MEIYPKVYISLVNYNSWKETIECLESILANDYASYEIIVVDNNSVNESVAKISHWLKINSIEHKYSDYKSERVQLGFTKACSVYALIEEQTKISITFICSKTNTGFAGGNNTALEFIYGKGDADFVWMLNNDTVIDKSSLSNQIDFYKKNINKKIAILGSKILYYHRPDIIQCIGGSSYNRWTGYSKQIGNSESDNGQYDTKIEKPDLIIGASMLLTVEFVNLVNYLDENYFLYFEEQDLAKIATNNNYSINYAVKSIVYHKEGKTIGASNLQGKTLFSDFYYTRSKILFTYKHYQFLNKITIRISILLTVAKRIISGKLSHIPLLIRIMMMPVDDLKKKTYETLLN